MEFRRNSAHFMFHVCGTATAADKWQAIILHLVGCQVPTDDGILGASIAVHGGQNYMVKLWLSVADAKMVSETKAFLVQTLHLPERVVVFVPPMATGTQMNHASSPTKTQRQPATAAIRRHILASLPMQQAIDLNLHCNLMLWKPDGNQRSEDLRDKASVRLEEFKAKLIRFCPYLLNLPGGMHFQDLIQVLGVVVVQRGRHLCAHHVANTEWEAADDERDEEWKAGWSGIADLLSYHLHLQPGHHCKPEDFLSAFPGLWHPFKDKDLKRGDLLKWLKHWETFSFDKVSQEIHLRRPPVAVPMQSCLGGASRARSYVKKVHRGL